MSWLANPRVRVPERAKRGEVFEIRAMVDHPMESGFRLDNVGKPITRNIVQSFTCTYDGHEVFRAVLHPAVSTNPYFLFYAVASNSGELHFDWTDDQGDSVKHVARIEVEG
ncbi:MAG TPA: thiosulfate oxidation carrier complex protein SoxZ [Burkholderiales bacterium]|nr:thiosulfate oxidation carrier complex protein SoxZ [Burkholderiales bacterium]